MKLCDRKIFLLFTTNINNKNLKDFKNSLYVPFYILRMFLQ